MSVTDSGTRMIDGVTLTPKQVGLDGPCSFHSEYQGSFSFKDMTTQELIEQTREDLKYVRQVLADLAAC